MHLGIYGDSYGDAKNKNGANCWFNVLAKYLSIKNIDNYSESGSSLYFSYTNFLTTNHKYDTIIFLATDPNRYPIKFSPVNIGCSYHITSVAHIEQLQADLNKHLTEEEQEFLLNLRGWFKVSNKNYNLEIADAILSNIETLRPDVIMYPCFSSSFTKDRFVKNKLDQITHPLHSFWIRQLDLLEIDPDNFTAMEKDTLAGHLTEEFNEYIAKMFLSKITTGYYDHSGLLDITIKKPKTYYYKNWD